MRTNLVRFAAFLAGAGAVWAGRQVAIGFRQALIVHAYNTRTKVAHLEHTIGDMRGGRVPLQLYPDTESFAAAFNTAYGAIVRQAKDTGAIPQNHPERLDFRTPPIVRSSGINGIMKRGRDGYFQWVDPKTGEFPA
jgi:hypothetical protein